jgi:hypothetical protein
VLASARRKPVVVVFWFCLLAACGDDAEAEDPGSTSPAKDASVRARDASRDARQTAVDAEVEEEEEPEQTAKPSKDAGKDAAVDAGALEDAAAVAPKDAGTPAGDAGPSVSGIAAADLDRLRTVCVDEINMYRATLSLTPLTRPAAQYELCSDEGAKQDGDSKVPHGWANAGYKCSTPVRGFSGQNTCPGWPAANATAIASSLKKCLQQMWAEGEPPEGEAKCKSDYFAGKTECFLAHGHYLNMKNMFKSVSCGFYDMGKSTYWMNQDFL